MKQIKLKYDHLLKGDFEPGKYNFLFTFQVNCPGCFLYGIPVFNSLYNQYKNSINFLGLSTAFEDFEFNNINNTQALISNKTVVGETQKALKEKGFDAYPINVDFPIAMDSHLDKQDLNDQFIDSICALNPNFPTWSEYDQQLLRKNVRDYLIRVPSIFYTFTINQFKGTPTFVLFDDQYQVYEEWFGHRAPEEITKILDEWL